METRVRTNETFYLITLVIQSSNLTKKDSRLSITRLVYLYPNEAKNVSRHSRACISKRVSVFRSVLTILAFYCPCPTTPDNKGCSGSFVSSSFSSPSRQPHYWFYNHHPPPFSHTRPTCLISIVSHPTPILLTLHFSTS